MPNLYQVAIYPSEAYNLSSVDLVLRPRLIMGPHATGDVFSLITMACLRLIRLPARLKMYK